MENAMCQSDDIEGESTGLEEDSSIIDIITGE